MQNEQKTEVPTDEAMTGKFKEQTNINQTRIITGKKKNKKYYDKSGNLITDKDLIELIHQGANVISYHEQIPVGAKESQYDKRNKTLIRSKK